MFVLKVALFSVLAVVAFGQSAIEKEALDAHNNYRAKHGVPALKLSSELTALAQDWANYLAANDVFEHRPDNDFGENLYAYSRSPANPGQMATDSWYNEINEYDFNNPGFDYATGHFTQVVWKNTEEMGIAIAESESGWVYIVANYNPAGNYEGEFEENVPRPLN